MSNRPVRRTAARVAGAVVLLAASVATSGSAAGVDPPATTARVGSPTWSSGNGVLTLDWGDLDKTPQASRGDVVVMQSWEFPRIPALRRQHPGVTILMYKDVSAVVKEAESTTGRFPAGMGYGWVARHHPSWLLHDSVGAIIEWSDWRGLYPINIANSAYQRTWSRNVLAELREHQWDGVMMDDVLTILSHDTVGGRVSTRIPDDEAQYAATASFLSRVAPQVRRAGYLAVPNLSVEWDNWRTTLADWTPYVSGWVNEHFTNWPGSSDRFVGADWRWKFHAARWLAARDIPLIAVSYGSATDRVGQTYHRATWLLSWNGRTGASVYVPDEPSSSHWLPAATRSIGRPVGPAVRAADGTWTRRFSHGIVAVNPTASARPVALRGTYTRAERRVRAVRLAPTTAVILDNR
ncbi:putative glycoside hydrolase [Nocardioides conyzicola]|uniref:Glycosyl hydrolase-like family 15 (GHL15) protein n=1 Tax=Nocardioides conyzicola TaxID=1651781 RepID=A0ABP8WTH7_9ACTN